MKKKKKTLLYRIWKGRYAYFFVLPLVVLMGTFWISPPFTGISRSFTEWDGVMEPVWVGLDNFKKLFQDKIFLDSIPTMFWLNIPGLFLSMFANLLMAELLFNLRNEKLQAVFRVLLLLPMVAPGVVGTLIWKNIFEPQNGLLNEILRALHILEETEMINWLSDFTWVIPALIFMGFPWIGGGSVLIYISGLNAVSGEMLEASRLDGCSTWKRILLIDLPNLAGQIRYFLVFGIISALQSYSTQVVLTNGGPGYTTMVPGYYMYKQGFGFGNMGYACAIGTFLFVVIGILTGATYRITHPKEDA